MQFYRFHSSFTTQTDPLQELVSFAKKSGTAGTSYSLRELSRNAKGTLYHILLNNPFLLFEKYKDYDTVWRWLIKHDYFLIIKFILNKASGGKLGIRWYIPSNRYDKNNGSTIFTDPSLHLSARLFGLLLKDSFEELHLYNKMTNETVLHILAKQGKVNIMKNIIAEKSTDLDPNLADFTGRTALHYALERGELGVAELLVERFGADWNLGMKDVSNETLASRHPECVEFLYRCREKYSIQPNSEGGGETCVICLEKIETSAYSMPCCKVKLHTVCLRKHLARAEVLCCLICRQEICKDLYEKTPNTVFKREQTQAAVEPAMQTEPEATMAVLNDDTTYQTECGIQIRFTGFRPIVSITLYRATSS